MPCSLLPCGPRTPRTTCPGGRSGSWVADASRPEGLAAGDGLERDLELLPRVAALHGDLDLVADDAALQGREEVGDGGDGRRVDAHDQVGDEAVALLVHPQDAGLLGGAAADHA